MLMINQDSQKDVLIHLHNKHVHIYTYDFSRNKQGLTSQV